MVTQKAATVCTSTADLDIQQIRRQFPLLCLFTAQSPGLHASSLDLDNFTYHAECRSDSSEHQLGQVLA